MADPGFVRVSAYFRQGLLYAAAFRGSEKKRCDVNPGDQHVVNNAVLYLSYFQKGGSVPSNESTLYQRELRTGSLLPPVHAGNS
jgi:hypothetical protein